MGREAGNMTWTSFYCRSFPAVPPHKAEITCHKKPRHARPRYYCLPELERFWAKHVQWLLKAQSYAAELNDCSKPYSMHTNTSTRTCVRAPTYIYVYIYIYICIHVICYVLHLKIVRAKIHDNRLDETVASCMCWTMHCLSRQKRGLASKSKESVPSISNDCSKPNHIGPSAMTAQSPARSAKTSTETCIRAPTYIYIYI